MKILKKIAQTNGKELPENITLKPPDEMAKTSGSPLDLFRTAVMAKKTAVQMYAWYDK